MIYYFEIKSLQFKKKTKQKLIFINMHNISFQNNVSSILKKDQTIISDHSFVNKSVFYGFAYQQF